MVTLYELCQKYIYYTSSRFKLDIRVEKNNNGLINSEKYEYFHDYFINLKEYHIVRKMINNDINTLIKILKYKNIFEETLSFQLDENNEYIKYVQINYCNFTFDDFDLDDNENQSNKDNTANICYNSNNLNNIIMKLKEEKLYFYQIINSIERINAKN